MSSIVVYDQKSKDVLAIIPLNEGEQAVCRNDVAFKRFDDSEPVLVETENGVKFKENAVFVKL